jgi:hypothetical protein
VLGVERQAITTFVQITSNNNSKVKQTSPPPGKPENFEPGERGSVGPVGRTGYADSGAKIFSLMGISAGYKRHLEVK